MSSSSSSSSDSEDHPLDKLKRRKLTTPCVEEEGFVQKRSKKFREYLRTIDSYGIEKLEAEMML